MSAKTSFRFDTELWLQNRQLRACSPAARGFWVDVLCLCHPSGYLVLPNGKAVTDDQLAGLVGSPVKLVRGWLKELGEAGIFSVSEDNLLCSSRMVKEAAFVAQAKEAGARGQARKKQAVRPVPLPAGDPAAPPPDPQHFIEAGRKLDAAPFPTRGRNVYGPASDSVVAVAAPAKKPLDWWKSPAGWVRQGAQQALSMNPDEVFEDFQIRLSARIPPGRHLDVLTPGQRAAVTAQTPKDPNEKKDAAA